MSLGLGIFLLVIGAILTFALNVDVSWMDLDLVGYIFMGAGVVIIILGVILLVRKRHSSVTVNHGVNPAAGESYNTTERRDDIQP